MTSKVDCLGLEVCMFVHVCIAHKPMTKKGLVLNRMKTKMWQSDFIKEGWGHDTTLNGCIAVVPVSSGFFSSCHLWRLASGASDGANVIDGFTVASTPCTGCCSCENWKGNSIGVGCAGHFSSGRAEGM